VLYLLILGYRYVYILRAPKIFMKVIKSLDKKVGDTTYYKYKINLPKKIVEKGNLLDKDLEIKFEGDDIIIKKIKK